MTENPFSVYARLIDAWGVTKKQAHMTDNDKELAIKLVCRWLRKEKGYRGDISCLAVEMRGDYIDVMMLAPHGLFIIGPDLSIEDNYQVFTRKGD